MKKKQSIHIFASSSTPRLLYLNSLVFDLLLGLEPCLCKDLESFKALKSPKISYSEINIENSFHIYPASLLFQNDIRNFTPSHSIKKGIPILFPSKKGDLDFDPLAASFYVTSRYEEYNPFPKDEHDRFPAKASIQDKLDCLHLPIVQIWASFLGNALLKKFPKLKLKKIETEFKPTFDIDMAWSYKQKGAYRQIGAILKDTLSFNFTSIYERWKVINNLQQDPFDTFSYIEKQTAKINSESSYFFLMGKKSSYDKNINPTNLPFIKLIQRISKQNSVGIHPSYYSDLHLEEEIKALENATGKAIVNSRQHFLRLRLPRTYRHLIENQIQNDYTMGYADKIGFRNGLAIPSLWYDLEAEKQTQLTIHPLQIMDVTLKNYLSLSPEQAVLESKKIIDTIYKYGGTLISLWHNSSFDKQWKGWEKVFEEILSYANNRLNNKPF